MTAPNPTLDALHKRGLEIDLEMEHCEACQRTGLCRQHEDALGALADAAVAAGGGCER